MSGVARWVLAAALVGVLVGVTEVGAAISTERDLLALSEAAVGDSLPPQWERRVVRGSRSPVSVVRDDRGDRILSISGQRQAAWYTLDLRRAPLSRDGAATLAYRLSVIPAGSNLVRAEHSDAALRLYFVFESTRRFLPNPRMLMYSFGAVNDGPRVQQADNLCDIRLLRTSTTAWQQAALTPAADAARDCGWTTGRIVAVGMMQDTDQTGSRAEAEIRALTWRE